MTDIEISRNSKKKSIIDVAKKIGINSEDLVLYGDYKAKIKLKRGKKRGKLILVTAISPTPMGEGKTTVSIGLGDALNKIGKNVVTGGGSMVSMDIIPYMQAQGDRATLFGLNLVGLKRNRVPINEIENIKHAYKILFMSNLMLNDALEKVKEDLGMSPYIQEILNFISKSQRGICRPK